MGMSNEDLIIVLKQEAEIMAEDCLNLLSEIKELRAENKHLQELGETIMDLTKNTDNAVSLINEALTHVETITLKNGAKSVRLSNGQVVTPHNFIKGGDENGD